MNILQGISSQNVFCVTLNDESSIAAERILQRIVYHHPVFTTRRAAAQRRHCELTNHERISYCGAYWGNGFHEDGVNSALAVCKSIRILSHQGRALQVPEASAKWNRATAIGGWQTMLRE
jgi:predicted NAD/FAD-binding protein